MLLQHESLAIAPQQLFHCLIVPFFLFPFGIKTKLKRGERNGKFEPNHTQMICHLKALHNVVLHNFVQHKLVYIIFFAYLCSVNT